MASWLKWPLFTIGSCVLIALFAFVASDRVEGPRTTDALLDDAGNTRWDHPLVQRVWRLQDEILASRIVYSEQEAFDVSYAELPGTPGVTVITRQVPEALSQVRDTAWAAQARAERDSMRVAFHDSLDAELRETRSRARVALVEVPAPDDGVYWWYQETHPARYFAGRDSAGGYCLGTFSGLPSLLLYGEPLGPCRVWLRYGAPSAPVLRWLAHSGHVLEFDSVLSPILGSEFVGPQYFSWYDRPGTSRRALFGIRQFDEEADYIGLGAQGCLAGREELCLDAVMDPDEWRFRRARVRGSALQTRSRYSALETIGALFGEVERELGPEGFAQFWTASTEPQRDLEAALGEDLNRWLMHWLREQFGPEPRGPVVPPATLLLALLTVAALTGAALLMAARRQIR